MSNATVIYSDSAPFPNSASSGSKRPSWWWAVWGGVVLLVLVCIAVLVLAVVCIVKNRKKKSSISLKSDAMSDSLLLHDPTYQPQRFDDFHHL